MIIDKDKSLINLCIYEISQLLPELEHHFSMVAFLLLRIFLYERYGANTRRASDREREREREGERQRNLKSLHRLTAAALWTASLRRRKEDVDTTTRWSS